MTKGNRTNPRSNGIIYASLSCIDRQYRVYGHVRPFKLATRIG
jgi:hypothetical protein